MLKIGNNTEHMFPWRHQHRVTFYCSDINQHKQMHVIIGFCCYVFFDVKPFYFPCFSCIQTHTHTQIILNAFIVLLLLKIVNKRAAIKFRWNFSYITHSFFWLPFTVFGFMLNLVIVIWFIFLSVWSHFWWLFIYFNVSHLWVICAFKKIMPAILSLKTFDTGREFCWILAPLKIINSQNPLNLTINSFIAKFYMIKWITSWF